MRRYYIESRRRGHTIKRRKANWIGHILHRNSVLKHISGETIEGEICVTGRQERRRKQLLHELT